MSVTMRSAPASESRTSPSGTGRWAESWEKEIVGDSVALSQLHEGAKMEVLLLDGDAIPTLSDYGAARAVSLCAMWLDTYELHCRTKAQFGPKAKTPKTAWDLHELALEARRIYDPRLFADPNYKPTPSL